MNDWLKQIEDNFLPLIFEGLNVSTRASVVEAMKTNQELNYKQAMCIIHSLNHLVFQYIGHIRTDPTFCQCSRTSFLKVLKMVIPLQKYQQSRITQILAEESERTFTTSMYGEEPISQCHPQRQLSHLQVHRSSPARCLLL